MNKEVSGLLRNWIAAVVLAVVAIVSVPPWCGNRDAGAAIDLGTVNEIIRTHQTKNNWGEEKVPLDEHLTLEGAAMDKAPPHSRKRIYEFNVGEMYLTIFIYHEGESVDAAHMALFGEYDESASELYEALRSMKVPTSFRRGSAMESWLGEQSAAEQPSTADDSE